MTTGGAIEHMTKHSMSLIHNAALTKIDVLGYRVALQRHHEQAADTPAA